MIDPREVVSREKFSAIKYVIPVVSGKGGVGKSLVSTALSLALSTRYKTGLLDLDFWGASNHVLLNAKNDFPEEEKGILPEEIRGIKFMSIAYYTQDNPLPIRGSEFTDAFLELMAVTRWDDTECLVLDMPPGMADPFLDILQYVKNGNFLVISTSSRLSVNIVNKTIRMLKEQNLNIIGLIENMRSVKQESDTIEELSRSYNVKHLGSIPYYQDLDIHLDSLQDFISTDFFQNIKKISDDLEI